MPMTWSTVGLTTGEPLCPGNDGSSDKEIYLLFLSGQPPRNPRLSMWLLLR